MKSGNMIETKANGKTGYWEDYAVGLVAQRARALLPLSAAISSKEKPGKQRAEQRRILWVMAKALTFSLHEMGGPWRVLVEE